MKTIEELRDYFKQDAFAMQQGIAIESLAEDGTVTCTLQVQPGHLNALGTVQGGLVYTLADFTFAVAVNAAGPAVTLQAGIHYLKAVKGAGATLRATAKPAAGGQRVPVYQVTVQDGTGADIALFTATGYRLGGRE